MNYFEVIDLKTGERIFPEKYEQNLQSVYKMIASIVILAREKQISETEFRFRSERSIFDWDRGFLNAKTQKDLDFFNNFIAPLNVRVRIKRK